MTTTTTATTFDANQSDSNEQSILDVCSKDTENSNDQESVAQPSTDTSTPRVGDDYQVDLPNLANCILQDVEFKDTLPSKKRLIDSSIAPGTTVVIQRGRWCGLDETLSEPSQCAFFEVHIYERPQIFPGFFAD